MALETTVEQVDARVPVTIVALDGELDASNFAAFVGQVQGLYAAGTRHLLLDLSALRFMASSGLVALHSIVRIMDGQAPDDADAGWNALHAVSNDASGGSTQTAVQLCAAQPAVQRVLDRTGLSRMFVAHADRASGIAAF